jgi:hypothetical protein
MSLEASLSTLLGSLVGGRVYPDVTPESAPLPLIVYQQVGGTAYEYADNTLPGEDNARMQVVVWSKARLEATTIARQARSIIVGNLSAQTIGAPVSLYDSDMKLYGSRTEFGIFYTP